MMSLMHQQPWPYASLYGFPDHVMPQTNPSQNFPQQAYQTHAPPILHPQAYGMLLSCDAISAVTGICTTTPFSTTTCEVQENEPFTVRDSPKLEHRGPTQKEVISEFRTPRALSPEAPPKPPLEPLNHHCHKY